MSSRRHAREDDEVPEAALEALPVFPLESTVLLPHMVISLHVFEPRYRQMVRDIADGHRALAIALLDEAGGVDAYGRPAVRPIAGLGVVRRAARLPDGRYNLILDGLGRVELGPELPPSNGIRYRRVAARRLADVLPADEAELAAEVSAVRALCSRVVSRLGGAENELMGRINQIEEPGMLADVVAAASVHDPGERLEILLERSVLRRLELAAGALGALFLKAEEAQGPARLGWGASPAKA